MRNIRKRVLTTILSTAVLLNGTIYSNGKTVQAEEKSEVKVTILGTSDLHGTLVPWDYASDSANVSGSLSQISKVVSDVRKENPNTILIDAGDSIQGNFIETFKDGYVQPILLAMKEMKYDTWTLGNHEFDFGLDVLKRATDQLVGSTMTPISANIYKQDGTRFIEPYKIVERDGLKIALIGITTPMVEQFKTPEQIGFMKFKSPIEETQKIIAELNGKVDAMIGIMHMGIDNENNISDTGVTDVANACPELDVIFAGHMHQLVKDKAINGVRIVEPGKYGQYLSRIDLTFKKDSNNKLALDKSSLNDSSYTIKGVESDKNIEALVKPYHDKLRADANIVIGEVKGVNMVDPDEIPGIPTIHLEDTPLIDLFHEVALYYSKADVVSLGTDNEKAKLNVGPIKRKDIAFNYTYAGGEVTVYEVTGAQLKKYMEWSADYYNTLKDGDITISFNPVRRASKYSTNDYFGGINYTIDLTKESGNRITDLKYKNGAPIKDTDKIKLGMNSYRMDQLLAKGGIFENEKDLIKKTDFDSKLIFGEDEGTIRNLTIKYIKEVKNGVVESKKQDNWRIVGIDRDSADYRKVAELVRSGELEIPTTTDKNGVVYTATASINKKDLPVDNTDDNETNTNPGDNSETGTNTEDNQVDTDKGNTSISEDAGKGGNLPNTGSAVTPNQILVFASILILSGAILIKRKKKASL
ncbi:5'-nucleotidase C-terminal domain-containing protein [Clostridium sp. CTA-7]